MAEVKYKWKTKFVNATAGEMTDLLEASLNELSDNGWEIFSIFPQSKTPAGHPGVIITARKKI